MRLLDKTKKYKRIAAALSIVLLVICIEILFNYPALVGGYDWLDLSENIQVTEEKGKEGYEILYENQEGLYIKQLWLTGAFGDKKSYTVETVELNPFGKAEEHTYKDKLHPWFSDYYTNINKTVTSLKITIQKQEGDRLESAAVSNRFEINKYRVLFFLIALSLFYCIFFEKLFVHKPEWYFALFSMLFGALLLVCEQPQGNVWDEEVHFRNAFYMASGREIEWNEAAEAVCSGTRAECNTKAEFAELRQVMDRKGLCSTVTEERTGAWISYPQLSYLPMAFFLRLGMMCKAAFSDLYVLGKLGNFLTYVLVMFWAIRLARKKKLLLAFIAMMPTPLFLACSYSYDSVTFSFITLACVLWANEMFFHQDSYRRGPLIAALLLFAVGCSAKLIYIPLMLIMIMLPRFQNSRKRYGNWRVIGALFLCIAAFALFAVYHFWAAGYLAGDIRGGETSLMGQAISLLRHPWAGIKMFARDILSFDNFRNSGNDALNNFFVGNLMFLNYYRWGVMPDQWCLLLIPVLLILLLGEDKETGMEKISGGQRGFLFCLILFVVILIWGALYLSFTPVGNSRIEGVQARYYLPILYLAALLVQNKKIHLQMDDNGLTRVSLVSAWVLITVSFYEFVLENRLF